MIELLNQIFATPMASLIMVCSIILLECLLSVDNAAVLATMVTDLPKEQRSKALHYGIIGAYVFRGVALLFASFIISIWWIKPLGGLYLMYLAYSYFKGASTEKTEDDYVDKNKNWIYRSTVRYLGKNPPISSLEKPKDI
jgi:YkoY family integral membrane protein